MRAAHRTGGDDQLCAPNLPSLGSALCFEVTIRVSFACVSARAHRGRPCSRPKLAAALAPLDSGRKAIRLREPSRGSSAAQREELLVSACGIPRREMEVDETRSVSTSMSTLPTLRIAARESAVTAVHVRLF